MFQFKKIGAGDSAFTVSFDQMIQDSLRRRLLDLGHRVLARGDEFGLSGPLGVFVLLMEDYPFELIGKLANLIGVVGRLEAFQQGQHSVIGRVY